MVNMKTNQIYIVVAIIIVILGIVFFTRGETPETGSETNATSTSNTVSTQNTSNSSAKTNTSAPVNTNTSIGGGTQTQTSIPSIPTRASLSGSVFKLTAYNGTAMASNSKYTLSFEDGKVNAKFCNTMSGDFVLDGSLIKVPNMISTKMFCSSPANIIEIENEFTSILGAGAMIYQTGNTVVISHSKGTVMVFTGFPN